MKSSKQVYFINIRLFSRIFCKNRFYSFIRNLYRALWSKHCIFSKIWPMLRYWHTSSHNNISHNNIFFKIVFASIISQLKCARRCKTGAVKKRKAKNVAVNENKVIFCFYDKCFGNYMKWLLLKHCYRPQKWRTQPWKPLQQKWKTKT